MTLGFEHLSIRTKLAIILGLTIFALAATRALGLSQLGAFLDRFKSYATELESIQSALLAVNNIERAVQADEALAALERLGPGVGLEAVRVRELRAAIRSNPPRPVSGDPQALALRELETHLSSRFAAARTSAAQAYTAETRIMNATYVSMLLLVLGAGVVAYLLIARMVTRPLRSMVDVADTVAAGDLSSQIETARGDELGQVMRALAGMNHSLGGLIGRVREAAAMIRVGAGEIGTANAGLAERVAGQAAALEQTAATIEQLTTAVAQNADHARHAAGQADKAAGIAEQGQAEVLRIVKTMAAIDTGARQVTDIIGIIDSIAFQTNILALNAAVEAARAGDQGRGFAVVATEVRALAQRSSSAAREIKVLIEDALRNVDEGGLAVSSAGTTMTKVVEAARDVSAIVGEIATITSQQANGLNEVSRAMASVDQKTRQNSSLVDRAAQCARTMGEQAAALHDAVAVFRLAGEEPGGQLQPPLEARSRSLSMSGAPTLVHRPAPSHRWVTKQR